METKCPHHQYCPVCGSETVKPSEPQIVQDLRFHLDHARKALPVRDSALVILLGQSAVTEYIAYLSVNGRTTWKIDDLLHRQIEFEGVQIYSLKYPTRQISVVMNITGEV